MTIALDRAAWGSPWRARSVRDKAVLAGGLLAAAVALPPRPAAPLVAAAALGLLVGPVRVAPRDLARLLVLPLLSVLIGAVTVALSVGWDGGVRLGIADPTQALDLGLRASAAVLAMLVLAASTPVVDLVEAGRRARVPDALIEVAALTYRLVFSLLAGAGAIRRAQEARLGFVDRRAALRCAGMATTSLLLRSWSAARRLEEGLAGRGYDAALRTIGAPRRRSTAFVLGSLALVAAIAAATWVWA